MLGQIRSGPCLAGRDSESYILSTEQIDAGLGIAIYMAKNGSGTCTMFCIIAVVEELPREVASMGDIGQHRTAYNVLVINPAAEKAFVMEYILRNEGLENGGLGNSETKLHLR